MLCCDEFGKLIGTKLFTQIPVVSVGFIGVGLIDTGWPGGGSSRSATPLVISSPLAIETVNIGIVRLISVGLLGIKSLGKPGIVILFTTLL
jgi:hypothetical protein